MTAAEIALVINALLDLAVRLARELPDDDRLRVEVEAVAARVRAWQPQS